MRRSTAFLALAVTLVACGTESRAGTASPRYTADVTVLENDEHGPQLCDMVMQSMPPQCGGPDVIGWDWAEVRHESVRGVRWGLYTVTGTWDGDRLTLTEPPREPAPRQNAEEPDRTPTPCPAPEGGCVGGAERSQADLTRIQDRVMKEKGVLRASAGTVGNRVEVTAWLATDELRERLDATYGKGVVVVESVLKPV
jgi:hypothetical protein